jgi:hypothetical protein|tara:strand:+ start:80 stop:310 length:231 start_codon:yes stop_codon:yes gene_type:complete
MEITLYFYDKKNKAVMVTKKFEPSLLDIDYNKSSKVCDPCAEECKKINKIVNNRKLSEIKDEEVSHVFLNIFESKG